MVGQRARGLRSGRPRERSAGAIAARIDVAFSGCTGRGLDNGAREGVVSVSLVSAIMRPLHTGYGMNGDLPP